MKRVVIAVALICAQLCQGAIIDVPGDQPTIQAGIVAATEGDTVLVAENHYYERIDLLGKSILVTSEIVLDGDTAHIANTIIDADTSIMQVSDTGSAVTFVNDEDSMSILSGFTIQNGIGTLRPGDGRYGGGIYCYMSGPRIENCVITANAADSGAGVYIEGIGETAPTVTLENCKVIGNGEGFGLFGYKGEATLNGCRLADNSGDGVRLKYGFVLNMNDCEMHDDEISCGYATYPNIMNSRLADCSFDGYRYRMTMNGSRLERCSLFGNSTNMKMNDDTLYESSVEVIDYPALAIQLKRCILLDSDVHGGSADMLIDSSLIVGYVLSSGHDPTAEIKNSTIIGQGLDLAIYSSDVTISASIIVANDEEVFSCTEHSKLYITCSDFFCPGEFDWLNCTPGILDTSGVYFFDPMFCDAASGDYHLRVGSPCLPENNDCDTLIGAFGAGCERECGDIFGVDIVDIDDVVFFLQYLYLGGAPPSPLWVANVNCDEKINLLDVVCLINYIFRGGLSPCDSDGDGLPDC